MKLTKRCIISQEPDKGTPIDTENGMIVVFKVSKGELETELPNVEGMSLSAAATKLSNMGYTVYEDPTGQYSDKVSKGDVIGYRGYESGEMVAPNTELYLILSLGKEPADSQN